MADIYRPVPETAQKVAVIGGWDLRTGQATAQTTATLVTGRNPDRLSIAIVNPSANTIFIGGHSSVTTGNGFPLLSLAGVALGTTAPIYCVSAAGGETLGYLEEVR